MRCSNPSRTEFGWSRATTSGAVSLNLIIYGLTAPFAAALMERFGVRRVVAAALALVAVGSGLTLVMTSAWQLWLLWGFAVGIGTGSLALVFGAVVANRWFFRHRGLVIGVFSAASSTGQLVFLPAIAQLAEGPGWRWAAGLVAAFAVALVPLAWWLLRDRPSDVGAMPYGAPDDYVERITEAAGRCRTRRPRDVARGVAFLDLLGAVRDVLDLRVVDQRADRDALHPGRPRPRHAGDHEREPARSDRDLRHRRHDRQRLAHRPGRLALPAVRLLLLPRAVAARRQLAAGSHVHPSLFLFILFYGLDWVATVPPTVALCRQHFGIEKAGVVFGWVFAAHMVGAGVAASYAGWIRGVQGDYLIAWLTAGGLCVLAAFACLSIPKLRTE